MGETGQPTLKKFAPVAKLPMVTDEFEVHIEIYTVFLKL